MSDNLNVAIIGAGMAGILAAIKLKEFGIKDITIFEKADGVGGTWRDNSYPGLHCDVCLLYTSPSPRDAHESRMPSSA